jgi:hypothetical protein
MNFHLEIDDSEVETAILQLVASLEAGYEDTLKKAATAISENVKENFLLRGGFDRGQWADLAPATIRARESKVKHGLQLFAQLDSPELLTGRMFRAATDTTGNADGSGFAIDSHSVAVGINTDEITYAENAMGLTSGRNPERNPMDINTQTEQQIVAGFDAELTRRVEEVVGH